MTNVIVIRQSDTERSYEAAQDGITAQGETLGTALDRLLAQTGESRTPLLLVRQDQPDTFFSRAEFNRLQALRRQCKERANALNSAKQVELRELIAKEFRATIKHKDRTRSCAGNR